MSSFFNSLSSRINPNTTAITAKTKKNITPTTPGVSASTYQNVANNTGLGAGTGVAYRQQQDTIAKAAEEARVQAAKDKPETATPATAEAPITTSGGLVGGDYGKLIDQAKGSYQHLNTDVSDERAELDKYFQDLMGQTQNQMGGYLRRADALNASMGRGLGGGWAGLQSQALSQGTQDFQKSLGDWYAKRLGVMDKGRELQNQDIAGQNSWTSHYDDWAFGEYGRAQDRDTQMQTSTMEIEANTPDSYSFTAGTGKGSKHLQDMVSSGDQYNESDWYSWGATDEDLEKLKKAGKVRVGK